MCDMFVLVHDVEMVKFAVSLASLIFQKDLQMLLAVNICIKKLISK